MLIVLKLLGAIAILIFGMKMTSEALQKMAGPQLRHLFGAMTRNRFSGVATGALITVAVQSSSATTVMTVSFVNAALLSLTQAISVIMGANIGTTSTANLAALNANTQARMPMRLWPGQGLVILFRNNPTPKRQLYPVIIFNDAVQPAGTGFLGESHYPFL